MAVARRGDIDQDGFDGIISFVEREAGEGLDVIDHVERRRTRLLTSSTGSPRPADVNEFYMPVDTCISLETGRIELPHSMMAYVRNSWGWLIAELTNGDRKDFPEDSYSVELCGPVKLYVRVEAELSISIGPDRIILAFDNESVVHIGARSHHKHPAATITTTDDPADYMEAISHLGSALKTLSCERSYPTLRGHPPLIERGDELSIPSILDRPKTGVTIQVPEDLRSVFATSSLAYYLGAEVRPADEPRLVTATGFEYPLGTPGDDFEATVERVLKQAFLLDCLVRTEGFYPVNLYERSVLEPVLDLDLEALYDRTIPEQLETYLDIPFSAVEDHVPRWKVTTHIDPVLSNLPVIPFVVNDLAVVRTTRGEPVDPTDLQFEALRRLMQNDGVRSATDDGSADMDLVDELVRPEEAGSHYQAWIGNGVPLNSSKATIDGYRNRLSRSQSDGDIDIAVICNDASMNREQEFVDEIYGSREELPFDVDIYFDLPTAELRRLLTTEIDFLHFIGHIDEDGFECRDGKFDAGDLRTTAVDSFLLNACSSFYQGMRLIEAGSIAGIVTIQDVVNSGAEIIGRIIARLLNQGFPIYAAVEIARSESLMGDFYCIIGDAGLTLSQAEPMPNLCEIVDERTLELTYKTYPTSKRDLGSMVYPFLGSNEHYFIGSGSTPPIDVSHEELIEFIRIDDVPLRCGDELVWSRDADLSRLTDR